MLARRTFHWLGLTVLGVVAVGRIAGQNAAPAPAPATQAAPSAPAVPTRKSVGFDDFVDSAIRQERRMTDLLRNFKPVVETYIQEEKPDSKLGTSPKGDDYFLSRLDLNGDAATAQAFSDEQHTREKGDKKAPRKTPAFAAGGFAQALFPDLNHFDRQK